MKRQFNYTPLALAVSALLASPLAFAVETDSKSNTTVQSSSHRSAATNTTNVTLNKKVDVNKDVDFIGTVRIGGFVNVNVASMAVVDDKQINHHNIVNNNSGLLVGGVRNTASVSSSVNGNNGNTGVNVAAGDNNQQANAAAISAADLRFLFGSSDAEIFAFQDAELNRTTNQGTTNTASLTNSVTRNNGNTGVNVAAGDSNQQKNDLAISVANASLAEASVAVTQQNDHNTTNNNPGGLLGAATTNIASLTNSVNGNNGNTGVNVGAGTNNQQYNGLAISATR